MLAHRYRRKSRCIRLRVILVITSVFIILVIAVKAFERKVSVFSDSYLPSLARSVTTDAVCSAVDEVLSDGGYSYGDFAHVKYSEGKAVSIETNSAKVNEFKNKVVAAAQKEAEKIHNNVMYVPLGAFTGLSLIANHGPKIHLSYCVTGSFSANLESTFESAGINQTVHHIKLIVTSEIVTASVDYRDTMTFTTDFEIAQSVIVGNAPTTYGGYFTPISR